MVSCWGYLSTCYLAIKLEKFTKYPAGQIVKYKLNNKKEKKTYRSFVRHFGKRKFLNLVLGTHLKRV